MSDTRTRGGNPLDSSGEEYSTNKEEYNCEHITRSFMNNNGESMDLKSSALPPFSIFSDMEGLGSRLHVEGISEDGNSRMIEGDVHLLGYTDLYSEGLTARLLERGGHTNLSGIHINGDPNHNSELSTSTSVPQYRPWEKKPGPHSPAISSTWPDSSSPDHMTSFPDAFGDLTSTSVTDYSHMQKLPSFQSQFQAFPTGADCPEGDQNVPSFHGLSSSQHYRIGASHPGTPLSITHQYLEDTGFSLPLPSNCSSATSQAVSPPCSQASPYPRSASAKLEHSDCYSADSLERPKSQPIITGTVPYNYALPETPNPRRRESKKKVRSSSLEGSESDTSVSEAMSQVAAVSSSDGTEGFKPPPNPGDRDKPVKKKRKRCGECIGCQRKDNCGECAPCRNEKSHQICKMRRCEKLTEKRPNQRPDAKVNRQASAAATSVGQVSSMIPLFGTTSSSAYGQLPSERQFTIQERFATPLCYQSAAYGGGSFGVSAQGDSRLGPPFPVTSSLTPFDYHAQSAFLPGVQAFAVNEAYTQTNGGGSSSPVSSDLSSGGLHYLDPVYGHQRNLESPMQAYGAIPKDLHELVNSYSESTYPNAKPGYLTAHTPLKSLPSCSSPGYPGEGSRGVCVDGELHELLEKLPPMMELPKLDKFDDLNSITWSKCEVLKFGSTPVESLALQNETKNMGDWHIPNAAEFSNHLQTGGSVCSANAPTCKHFLANRRTSAEKIAAGSSPVCGKEGLSSNSSCQCPVSMNPGTRRRCETNPQHTCFCQGKDKNKRGRCFTFGCGWSEFYNGCKFSKCAQKPRRFRLSCTKEVLTLTCPRLVDGVPDEQFHILPQYRPHSIPDPLFTLHPNPSLYDHDYSCVRPVDTEKQGGVSLALPLGSILLECAQQELHATSALQQPDYTHPARVPTEFHDALSGWLADTHKLSWSCGEFTASDDSI